MKRKIPQGESNSKVSRLEERFVARERQLLSAYELFREHVDKRLASIRATLREFSIHYQAQAKSTKAAIEDFESNLKMVQHKLMFLEKKNLDASLKNHRAGRSKAGVEGSISPLRQALLETIIQVHELTKDVEKVKEENATRAGRAHALTDHALQNTSDLREEVKKIRQTQEWLARSLNKKTIKPQPSSRKVTIKKRPKGLPALPSPAATRAGIRYINEIEPSNKIAVGVVSARGETPSKNDDFGAAFSNGRFVSACVCDGVGSSKNGGPCAEQAARSFLVYSRAAARRNSRRPNIHQAVYRSFARAIKAVEGRKFHESTMIAAVMDAATGNLSLGWMGDGTALLISKTGVREVLRQHRNESQEITRFISGDGHGGQEPEMEDLILRPGQVVLLASDGFGDFELDHDILRRNVLEAINSGISAQEICAKLVHDAIAAGADDNVTVALIGIRNPVISHRGCEPALAGKVCSTGEICAPQALEN